MRQRGTKYIKIDFRWTEDARDLIDLLAEAREVSRSKMVRDMLMTCLLLFDPTTKAEEVLKTLTVKPKRSFGDATKSMIGFLEKHKEMPKLPFF